MKNLEKIIIDYSKQMKVASLRNKTLNLLLDIIDKYKIKNILEIGTGVGYSSYSIIKKFSDVNIDTVEKSYDRYLLAKDFLSNFDNINVINEDCFVFNSDKKYDLIIIDGPKRKQKELFNHLLNFSSSKTIFFIDNIKLEKIRNIKEKTINQKKILESLDEFYFFLVNNNEIKFNYYDIDDGVMIGCKEWN